MSGLIPQPFIDEVLQRVDLVELIDSYVPLKKQGNAYVACCPFHSEKTPSFNVVSKKQFYHCFGCGVSGNAISFVMNYMQQGFTEAIDTLAARLGMQVPREKSQEKIQKSHNLYELLAQVTRFYQHTLKNEGKEAISYLQQRGLSGEIAKQFQLGYATSGWNNLENHFRREKEDLITTGMLIKKDDGKTYDRYRQRIMFPIHDRHGRIIGFGGRAIDDDQKPKYLNSPETVIFQKNRELYGLHQLLQNKTAPKSILIVEGYMDVIALAQNGISNAVAALGTATSTYHIQLMAKHCKQLIFCFDGDKAGRQAAWRALENCLPHLDSGIDPRFAFLPEGHDPDSFIRTEGQAAFENYLTNAKALNRYFIDTITLDIDLQNAGDISRLINLTKPYLAQIPEGTYKQLLLDDLARLTHIENYRLANFTREKSMPEPKEQAAPQTIHRSPIRLAIALLLQHPELYNDCITKIDIEALDGKGQKILKKILQQIARAPSINTAQLIEQWRDTPLFSSLGKLASWPHQVPEEALKNEFIDHIIFLQKQNQKNKTDQLLAKSRKEGLTALERIQLQELLQQRHQNVHDKK